MTMKTFAVIGLGSFGAVVARELAELNCRVLAIDTSRDRVQQISTIPSVDGVVGDATSRDLLANLKMDTFEAVVVSTGEDSLASILITLHLKELEAHNIIVKARSGDHAKVLSRVGANQTIIPETQMALKLANSLARSNMVEFLPLTGDVVVAELTPPKPLVGKTLAEANIRAEYGVLVVAVRKQPNDELIFIPDGAYQVEQSDVLIVVGRQDAISGMKG